MSESSEPTDVSKLLQRLVRGLDIERELRMHSVGPVWERVTGALSLHSRPVVLRSGVLVIEARSAAWMNELSLRREELRRALNAELKLELVREVRFRLGGGFPPVPPKPVPELREKARRRASELLSDVGGDGASIVAGALAARLRQRR